MEELILNLKLLRDKPRGERKRYRGQIHDLNQKLLKEMGDKEVLYLKDWVLVKQHHQSGEIASIFTKDSWIKKEQAETEYNQRKLKWIT